MAVICVLAVCLTAGIDLGIKYYIEKYVKREEEHQIWRKRGILRKVHNRGMMMSRLERYPLLVQLSSVFAAGMLLIWQSFIWKKGGSSSEKLGAALMLGGAVSNTYDRLKRRYVVDYLALSSKNKKVSDITFNLADLAIFAGAILTAEELFSPRKENKQD